MPLKCLLHSREWRFMVKQKKKKITNNNNNNAHTQFFFLILYANFCRRASIVLFLHDGLWCGEFDCRPDCLFDWGENLVWIALVEWFVVNKSSWMMNFNEHWARIIFWFYNWFISSSGQEFRCPIMCRSSFLTGKSGALELWNTLKVLNCGEFVKNREIAYRKQKQTKRQRK